MTDRITRPMIDRQLDLLNGNLAQCPCLTGAYLRVGLSVWRPGDGWTRYQLVTADDAYTISRVCTAREIYETLITTNELLNRLHYSPLTVPGWPAR